MGVVYRATSLTHPGTTVALKVIRDELAADEEQRQRFINEGRIIDALDHPNIVKVLDRGEHNQRLYIAMEYLAGRSLARILQDHASRGQLVPLPVCTAVLAQLVDAVGTIHSKGIVHRDITPANVIVLEGVVPTVKLLDFGIAKLDTATTLTAAGEILGTISYMAPERLQLRELTPASDVFSLGVLTYELVTLHKPFVADEPVAVLKQGTHPRAGRSGARRPETPPPLVSLITAMLRKDPAARPSDEGSVTTSRGWPRRPRDRPLQAAAGGRSSTRTSPWRCSSTRGGRITLARGPPIARRSVEEGTGSRTHLRQALADRSGVAGQDIMISAGELGFRSRRFLFVRSLLVTR